MPDLLIKATARLQEAEDPARQRPIIKIDPRHQEELMAHVKDAARLGNSSRASIDSGRDNPFRPDGEIYKLTNPIVDYYKHGPNQSRTQTPCYAELIDSDEGEAKQQDKSRARKRTRKRDNCASSGGPGDGPRPRPWWRRWLCCCCCCCSSNNNKKSQGQQGSGPNEMGAHGKVGANLNGGYKVTPDAGPTHRTSAKASNDLTQTKVDDCCNGRGDSEHADGRAYKSRGNTPASTQGGTRRQAKVVLVEGHESMDRGTAGGSRGETKKTAMNETGASAGEPNQLSEATTQARTSKCVVS